MNAFKIAQENLNIHDVYLRNLTSELEDDFNPKYSENINELLLQNKHHIKEFKKSEFDDGTIMLSVTVSLGMRWVEQSDDDDYSVKAVIEADYVAEYIMGGDLTEDALNVFLEKYASYHIWPYWRELLSSQCTRMQLPKITLPVMQSLNKDTD